MGREDRIVMPKEILYKVRTRVEIGSRFFTYNRDKFITSFFCPRCNRGLITLEKKGDITRMTCPGCNHKWIRKY